MHESTGSALDLDLMPDHRRPRLLVVDDQPTNIELLYRLFADEYQVFMATNGPQALAKVEAEPPDLILLDWVMPGMNGLAVCEALKSNPDTRDIPVLFVTASHAPEEETRALEVGGVDFITKPINPAAVKARVRTHLTLKLQTDLLKRMAFLDGLTGIFNRRYFDDRLSTEMARAARDGRQLGLVLIDVDHFKLFNDHYGHQAGDDCLRAVARALKQTLLRPADAVARYGGEEFVCVLPDTDLAGAMQVAQRLIDAVSALGMPHAASLVAPHVTASAGVAVTQPGMRCTPQALLALSDTQLYQAKRQGRMRVMGQQMEAVG